ncbi:MAG: PQQ-binding-like beta-propeller repeat protein, partial [Novipirellula sp. JB048]
MCLFSLRASLPIVLGFVCACSFTSAEDWLGWRGADRANRSSETGLFESWGTTGPSLQWMASGLGGGYASVSVAGNRIYTTGNFEDSQSAVAIDADSGKVLWKQPITDAAPQHGYAGSRTTPTIDHDRLYMVSSDGRIVCLNAHNGDPIWARDFKDWNGKMMSGWGFSESPLVDGARVICTPGGESGLMVALDKTNGEEIWACKLAGDDRKTAGKQVNDGAGYSSPV